MSGGLAPTDLGTESLSADELVVHVESSIQLAEIHRSKLSPPDALEDAASVLKLPGFSGLSTRHLLNNLCGVPLGGSHTRYLEVGAWRGSTCIAACYHNPHVQAVVIDDWSEFGGSQKAFESNVQRLIPHAQLRLVSADWRQLGQQDVLHAPTAGGIAHNASQSDMQQGLHLQQDCKSYSSPACPELPAVSGHGQSAPFHVYLYDGGHTYLEQYRALTHFWDILADPCVLIVDDWNWSAVRKGTLDALQALQPRILLQHEIRLTQDDSHTPLGEAVESFWNGLGVFVLGK